VDVYVQPLQAALVREARTPLLVRFGAVALVFLTICSNVAGLLLVRAQARRGEFATRAALGATRARLFRQLAIETLIPFLLAWPLSALVAGGLVNAFRNFSVAPDGELAHADVSLDRWALLFSLTAMLVAGLISAWVPALAAARTDLLSVLRQAGTGAPASSGSLLRPALVVAQIALAFALSTVGGLALSALLSTLQVPAGFEPRGLVSAHLIGFTDIYAADEARGREILARVSELMRKTAGVRSVAANTALPLAGYEVEVELRIEGREAPAGAAPAVGWNSVTQGYFETLGMPILKGRGVLPGDGRDATPVAMISQQLAEQYFPHEDPIGRFIKPGQYGADRFRQIVGVVGDVRRHGVGSASAPEVYVPLEQEPGAAVLVARSDQPQLLLDALPGLVGSVEPSLGVRSTRLDERMRATLREPYQITMVLGAFAGVALVLASLALYSLVARASMVRTRELAIRTALGSPPARLLWLVMRGGLTWLLSGAFIGLTLAWGIGHWVSWGISGWSAFDARVYGGVSSVLGVAGLLASFVPAWRATRMSLPEALKCE
jgi:putative ABC transport system permease protein